MVALLVGVNAVLVSIAGLLTLDFVLHRKFDEVASLNRCGYRGAVIGRKQNSEKRIVVVGGSTALGYGVRWQEAFPAVLEGLLRQATVSGSGSVSVVNLACNNDGAYSFRFTLEDYEYLDYDAVIFYSGYNNLTDRNTRLYRRQSPVFRLTGYHLLLPLVMREKAMSLRYGGHLEAAYQGDKTVFNPGLADRTLAGALEQGNRIGDALGRQLEQTLPEAPVGDSKTLGTSCGNWPRYCNEMYAAVKYVLDRGRRALVVSQPHLTEPHPEQQRLMVAFLRERFGHDARLQVVDLGLALDLTDQSIAYDGMHLTASGNRTIAERLLEPVQHLLE